MVEMPRNPTHPTVRRGYPPFVGAKRPLAWLRTATLV